ncbi:hypothetical protein LJ739_07685 [Aestuariibacter halophilus]|uniref:Uncharacterized protein n=1 Tax=Fluctibacter halophilus TaxID=226011 RepID=A0ABS8G7R0_9ALTE|nr:hypothetical protein [Aestuariibacter halophilus]MCC2616116.1 hypothetical protein [Aestuariibacter halophilus]
MKLRVVGLCAATLAVSGCASFQSPFGTFNTPPATQVSEQHLCVDVAADKQCALMDWVTFWFQNNELSWRERKQHIERLSGDSPALTLKKVLLSQGRGTPYQDRLRAQNQLDGLLQSLSGDWQRFFHGLVYSTSQESLEYESALTILTRINARQSREIEELKGKLSAQEERLKQQQAQIEQFLKIEASMMEKREGIEP